MPINKIKLNLYGIFIFILIFLLEGEEASGGKF